MGSASTGGSVSRGGSASKEGLGTPPQALWNTVNKQAVCILLECILVWVVFADTLVRVGSVISCCEQNLIVMYC